MKVYSLRLVSDHVLDPGTALLDEVRHPDSEIVRYSLQNVTRNSANFPFDVFFRSVNGVWTFLILKEPKIAQHTHNCRLKSRQAMSQKAHVRSSGRYKSAEFA